jgi:hypothetical protein
VVKPLGPGRFAARFTGGPDQSPGPISPGQPAVCYAADRLLGGGWLQRAVLNSDIVAAWRAGPQ